MFASSRGGWLLRTRDGLLQRVVVLVATVVGSELTADAIALALLLAAEEIGSSGLLLEGVLAHLPLAPRLLDR